MATRGCIARLTEGRWEGRYHHWDSYPEGLGRTLWALYHGFFGRDLGRMLRVLIDEHPAGWSTIVDVDFRLRPGWVEAEIRAEGQGPRRPVCYCHGERNDSPLTLWEPLDGCPGPNSPCDPLFIEWVYVLRPSGLLVLASCPAPRGGYRHVGVADVPWTGPEPDWAALDRARQRVPTVRTHARVRAR